MTEPNLGTTWNEAIDSSYIFGFNCWENSRAEMIDDVREVAENESEDMAVDMLNIQYQAVIKESGDTKRFWRAVDEFFAEQMPPKMNERYQREAVVAEDFYMAYESGCYDAILGKEKDLSKLSMFYE